MSRRFFAEYDIKELKSRMSRIIEVRHKDILKTHFNNIVLFKDERKVSGTIMRDRFKIWTHEQGRGGATGYLYPVIEGFAKPLNNGLEIAFRSKMNLIARIVSYIFIAGLSYAILTEIIIQDNNDFNLLLRRSIVGILLLAILILGPMIIYYRICRIIIRYLVKELELKASPKN